MFIVQIGLAVFRERVVIKMMRVLYFLKRCQP